jgi:hypothetical protein
MAAGATRATHLLGGHTPVIHVLSLADEYRGQTPNVTDGHTTETVYRRLAVVDGALVWDEP